MICAGSVAEKSVVWRVAGVRLEDRVEVLGETHVEHLVRFVEHEDVDGVEAERAAAQVIERPARRRDDDVAAALEARICCVIDAPP